MPNPIANKNHRILDFHNTSSMLWTSLIISSTIWSFSRDSSSLSTPNQQTTEQSIYFFVPLHSHSRCSVTSHFEYGWYSSIYSVYNSLIPYSYPIDIWNATQSSNDFNKKHTWIYRMLIVTIKGNRASLLNGLKQKDVKSICIYLSGLIGISSISICAWI